MQAAEFAFAVLCNSLWQAPLIALITAGVLRIARGASASTRYAAWMIALTAVVVVPIVTTFITLPRNAPAPAIAPPTHVSSAAAPPRTSIRVSKQKPVQAPPARFELHRLQLSIPREVVLAGLAIWAVLVLALLVRLFVDFLALERLKRDALPLPIEYREELERWPEAAPLLRTVRLCVSTETEVPVAVGLFDAMILLPAHLLESFSSREIDQIALHELAHLQRNDDWSNGFQRVIVALLFFNPAVRWIAQRLDLDREVACDDSVVALTRDVRPYAKCLAKMAEVTAWPHHALAAPGVFVTRKSISVRIEELLKRKSSERGPLSIGVIGAGAVATCAFFVAATLFTPVIASTQVQAPKPAAHPVMASHTVSPRPAALKAKAPAAAVPKQRVIVYVTPSPAPEVPQPKAKPPVHQSTIVAAATPAPRRHAPPRRLNTTLNCTGCNLDSVDWSNRDLHGMNLRGANFANANLTGADLHDADLTGANMAGARLAGANLNGTSLRGANLADMSFKGVNFRGADLSGANIDVRTLDPAVVRELLIRCHGCNFAGADLRNQNLRGIQVTGANFDHVDLRGADLSDASFTGVNFNSARFDGARMNGTLFTGCNFASVDMRTADFSQAKMIGSNFSGAILP